MFMGMYNSVCFRHVGFCFGLVGPLCSFLSVLTANFEHFELGKASETSRVMYSTLGTEDTLNRQMTSMTVITKRNACVFI